MRVTRTLIGDLAFAEGTRWRDNALYFSDMHGGRVLKIGESGEVEVVAQLDDDATSGLGWLPDGRLLVVAMESRRIMRREHDGTMAVHADLSSVASFHANDMIVAPDGVAYVGNFGFPIFPLGEARPTALARVSPDGTVTSAADDMWFPNGVAMTDDRRTLIVAESAAFRLTAFTVNPDGSLSDRRVWAELGEGNVPDGLCLDSEGAAWVATPLQRRFIRVREGGEVVDTIPVEHQALACALGGAQRRTLFMATSRDTDPDACMANPSGAIRVTEVDVPGAGWP